MAGMPGTHGTRVTEAGWRTNTRSTITALPSWMRRLRFYLLASRPGMYLPTVWFYLLPVTQQRGVFSSWTFWLGMLYFTLPVGLLVYGWNDLSDAAIDHQNPRKGGRLWGPASAEEELARLPLVIALLQLPFVAIFTYQEGPRFLLWFAGLLFANLLYNAWPFRFRARPVLDLLNQNAYLGVFVLSGWLNDAPALPWSTILFGSLFAMLSHLFGQIMDYPVDQAKGRRTTAVVLGLLAAKWLFIGFLVAVSALLWFVFHSLPLGAFFAAAALWFTLDTTLFWRDHPYTSGQMRLFGHGLVLAPLVSIPYVWQSGVLTRLP
jgi:4-hydroxybenzoate polyprenyltransferase